jgi:hypothetical protein
MLTCSDDCAFCLCSHEAVARDNTRQGQYASGTIHVRDNTRQGQYTSGTIRVRDNTRQGQYTSGTIHVRDNTRQGQYASGSVHARASIRQGQYTLGPGPIHGHESMLALLDLCSDFHPEGIRNVGNASLTIIV